MNKTRKKTKIKETPHWTKGNCATYMQTKFHEQILKIDKVIVQTVFTAQTYAKINTSAIFIYK